MIDRAELIGDIERIIRSKGVRSADRAYMQSMLRQMREGNSLTYQERVNLWAYLNRYRSYLA